MRVLVTGASGFIGSAVAAELLKRGHRVAGITRQEQGVLPAGVVWMQGDLHEPPWAAIEEFAPDACIHSAWIATPGVYLESPENREWIRWSLAFLEQLAAMGVSRILGLGTCIEYELTTETLREDTTPLRPLTLYAKCKAELRQCLKESPKMRATSFAWARIFYPYGEGEHPERLCTSLVAKLSRGEPLVLNTPASTKDYIHIHDVATALAAIVESDFRGDINVGTGEGITVERLAREVAARLGKSELVQMPAHPKTDPFPHVVACADRLRKLGWRPAVTLEQGVEQLTTSLLYGTASKAGAVSAQVDLSVQGQVCKDGETDRGQ